MLAVKRRTVCELGAVANIVGSNVSTNSAVESSDKASA